MRFISNIHSAIYGIPTLTLIVLVFLLLNIRTRFIGVRKLPYAIKAAFRGNKDYKRSPLSSACVSLSATVGTGNIVGVAGAITLGGPGAVFWMWVSALTAFTVKFSEIYLSSVYKKENGAYGYIYAAINSKTVKCIFMFFGIIAAFGIGNLTQSNAAAASAAVALSGVGLPRITAQIVIGVLFSTLSAAILHKESSTVKFCERVLPVMSAAYILLCITSLFLRRTAIPGIFAQIFKGAFSPQAVTGGAVGSVISSVKTGVARGIFSNEAGLSTAALAYEKNSAEPKTAALFGIFEVFVDTIILCTLTALVVLSWGQAVYGVDSGAHTTLSAFTGILGKEATLPFAVIICFFAFSSVIGWGVYARKFADELKINPDIITGVYCSLCVLGAVFSAGSVWQIAEIGSILMMTVNCCALLYHGETLSYKKLGYEYGDNRKKRHHRQASPYEAYSKSRGKAYKRRNKASRTRKD